MPGDSRVQMKMKTFNVLWVWIFLSGQLLFYTLTLFYSTVKYNLRKKYFYMHSSKFKLIANHLCVSEQEKPILVQHHTYLPTFD